MRLFIAINVDPTLKAPLAEIQERLKKSAAQVSWVKPENLHFTLKFLGEVPEEDVPAIREAFRRSVAGVRSFPLSLGGLGIFPPRGRPRVIWVGVEQGTQEVERLRGRIDEGLLPLGFPREERPFHPHLTLGRVKGLRGLDPLVADLRKGDVGLVGLMQVRSIELMQSQLRSAGAIYTPLETVPLEVEA